MLSGVVVVVLEVYSVGVCCCCFRGAPWCTSRFVVVEVLRDTTPAAAVEMLGRAAPVAAVEVLRSPAPVVVVVVVVEVHDPLLL